MSFSERRESGSNFEGRPAPRLKRPSWRDPRLLVGALLVLASLAGVVALVEQADSSVEVYAAREDLAVGQGVSEDLLVPVSVRLGEAERRYLLVRDGLPESKVVLQRVSKGDLLPLSSTGGSSVILLKPVPVPVTEPLPAEAVAGQRVDVWAARPSGQPGSGSFAEPELLVPAAEIYQLSEPSSALGGSRELVAHLLVDDDHLAALLSAQANGAKLSVVWNPSGAPREP